MRRRINVIVYLKVCLKIKIDRFLVLPYMDTIKIFTSEVNLVKVTMVKEVIGEVFQKLKVYLCKQEALKV